MPTLRWNRSWLHFFFAGWVFILPHIWSKAVNQNYIYPKRFLLEFLAAAVALALAFENRFFVIDSRLRNVTLTVIFLNLASLVLFPNWISVFSVLDSLIFAVLCFYFFNLWSSGELKIKNLYWLFTISSCFVGAFCLYEFIDSRVLGGELQPLFYSGTFGNINILSEYLALTLPLAAFFFRERQGRSRYLNQFILISWTFLLLAGKSRSAWIGLGLFFLYTLTKKPRRKELVSYFLGLGLFLATLFIPTKESSRFDFVKEESSRQRIEIYKGSTEMMLDNPLGVGPGGFIFNFIPYQMATKLLPTELDVADTPHSEFLKWGTERGWIYLGVIAAWWLFLLIKVFSWKEAHDYKYFCLGTLLVLGPQLAFQFPFENPSSSFVLSLLLSFILAQLPHHEIKTRGLIRWFFVICAGLLFYRASVFTYARLIESRGNRNTVLTRKACELNPAHWQDCYYFAHITALSYFPQDAEPVIRQELRLRPFDYQALRALGAYLVATGKPAESCDVHQVYDLIFNGQSSVHSFVQENCREHLSPLSFQTGPQFKKDYLTWVKKYQ